MHSAFQFQLGGTRFSQSVVVFPGNLTCSGSSGISDKLVSDQNGRIPVRSLRRIAQNLTASDEAVAGGEGSPRHLSPVHPERSDFERFRREGEVEIAPGRLLMFSQRLDDNGMIRSEEQLSVEALIDGILRSLFRRLPSRGPVRFADRAEKDASIAFLCPPTS